MTSEARLTNTLVKDHNVDLAYFNKLQKKAKAMTPDQMIDTITELQSSVDKRRGKWRKNQQALLCWKTIADMAGISYGEDQQKLAESRAKQQMIDEQLLMMSSYKRKYEDAKDRGITFELSFAQYCKIMSRKTCAYTGVRFSDEYPASLDRVDPTEGYTVNNTLKVCVQANNAKNFLLEMPMHKDDHKVRMDLNMLTKMAGNLNKLGFQSPGR